MKIRICNEIGRTIKIITVNNAFEILALSNRNDFWEYAE